MRALFSGGLPYQAIRMKKPQGSRRAVGHVAKVLVTAIQMSWDRHHPFPRNGEVAVPSGVRPSTRLLDHVEIELALRPVEEQPGDPPGQLRR
ncbi:hypothetical protein [Nonomuraea dietziae]|uniref:Uncharacterized protein n=1 Tax=Nonomuraea dietziae TaxID=65515 RepID=A0A7W5VDZ4_9ACTN|nr:hypothetical protein [Nonomuraea dietziae]MBB3733106.1 hypothetical protein [Nonomuraea dietziae]